MHSTLHIDFLLSMKDDDMIIGVKWRMENAENQGNHSECLTHFGRDISKTTTVRENILHAFFLDMTNPNIIMSVLHESLMFLASLCILDAHLTSFHHFSSRFLRVPACSSSGLLLIGPMSSHLATI